MILLITFIACGFFNLYPSSAETRDKLTDEDRRLLPTIQEDLEEIRENMPQGLTKEAEKIVILQTLSLRHARIASAANLIDGSPQNLVNMYANLEPLYKVNTDGSRTDIDPTELRAMSEDELKLIEPHAIVEYWRTTTTTEPVPVTTVKKLKRMVDQVIMPNPGTRCIERSLDSNGSNKRKRLEYEVPEQPTQPRNW